MYFGDSFILCTVIIFIMGVFFLRFSIHAVFLEHAVVRHKNSISYFAKFLKVDNRLII